MSDEDQTTPEVASTEVAETPPPATKTAAKKTAKKAPAKKAAAKKTAPKKTAPAAAVEGGDEAPAEAEKPKKKPAKKAAAKPKKTAAAPAEAVAEAAPEVEAEAAKPAGAPAAMFQAPEIKQAPTRTRKRAAAAPQAEAETPKAEPEDEVDVEPDSDAASDYAEATDGEGAVRRRPRRRGGRRRRKPAGAGADGEAADEGDDLEGDEATEGEAVEGGEETTTKRTRTRTRTARNPEDEIASVTGSTRLEAKKQRRREGREAGRRRAPIVSEAEFLARRESVDRIMVIRQREDLTQIGVVEDKVLVEHYVSREAQTSMIGNVYLGKVQNVLPSMEAAFIDIGKGRNAVLYAGEVNWAGLGHKDGEARKIESVLSPGQMVLVQVTKDPVGHKGARLTGQVSLPGRFLVYVPDGATSGISRKLPDTERNRLKTLLKQIVPDTAGVIVRTAAEGASEDELTADVERLKARWADIEAKVAGGKTPELLYGEPDLTLKVVRDLFTEDFSRLVVQGDEAWELVSQYVEHVAPDLAERLERFESDPDGPPAAQDVFAAHRIDEQIAKALDRKVWLPSGGSLIIDRTEAMTVVDVNTGKFTGSGGNLEETVTKNNLEAAEEIVRQLRLRDVGGIIVVDFIDMVLESNRDLVLRRLVECLGRDRTRHQVAEVTSLGLVQMTRKKIGTGLLEAFSEPCKECNGRGVIVHDHPVATAGSAVVAEDEPRAARRRGGRRGRGGAGGDAPAAATPSPKDLAGTHPQPTEPVEPLPMLNAVADEESEIAEVVEEEAIEQAVEIAAQPDTPGAEVAEGARHETEAEPEPETAVDQVVEPESSVVEREARHEAPVEAPGPVVVTETRRRRTASRPAGSHGAEAVSITVDPTAETAPETAPDGEPEHLILHVPVKRRGARKR